MQLLVTREYCIPTHLPHVRLLWRESRKSKGVALWQNKLVWWDVQTLYYYILRFGCFIHLPYKLCDYNSTVLLHASYCINGFMYSFGAWSEAASFE